MKADVPFYKNDNGKRCLQASMQSVLRYFTGREYSLGELDILTGRKGNYGTWTTQAAAVFFELGLEVTYYSKTALEPFLAGEPFIRERYGADADKILSESDLSTLSDSIRKVIKYDIVEYGVVPFDEIIGFFDKGSLPILLIDYNKIIGKREVYQGHFVIITGHSGKVIYYHDSGPIDAAANKQVNKNLLIEAWNANGTDNDVLIVGKK